MEPKDVIAAIDVGTSAVKVALIDRQGNILSRASSRYDTYSTPGGSVEQRPQDWWQATCRALWSSRAPETHIVALAMSGQMQDLILVSRDEALGPAILYSDGRATSQAEAMLAIIPQDEWISVTGNLQDASSLPAKLLWLQQHEPDQYTQAEGLLLGAHHYILLKATGLRVADLTTASTTGLMDLQTNSWAYDLLDRLKLRTDWLPQLAPSDQPIASLDRQAANLMGLPPGIPVFQGAGDAATTTLGVGAGEPGSGYIYLGTSGWIALTTEGTWADPTKGIYTLRHPNPAWTILAAPMLTAAGNLDWARSQMFPSLTYAQMEAEAASIPPGSGGIIYLPYLAGERAPFRDSHARGAVVGLSLATRTGHLIRAIMEGVALAFRTIYEAASLDTLGSLVVTGGGSRSALWCQILADVLGRDILRSEEAEDVALKGAALLAGRGLGWYASYTFPSSAREQVFHPDPKAAQVYDRLYTAFKELYPALRGTYARLAEFATSRS